MSVDSLLKPSSKPQPLDLLLRVGKHIPNLGKFTVAAFPFPAILLIQRALADPHAQTDTFVTKKIGPGPAIGFCTSCWLSPQNEQ
jgi:hypothetical protein